MSLNRIVIGVMIVAIGWLQVRLWIGEGSLAHVDALASDVRQGKAEIEQKEQRNKILRAEIMDLRAGLEAVEEKARSEFGLVKEGEIFFLLVEE